jgi:hypothetical protein
MDHHKEIMVHQVMDLKAIMVHQDMDHKEIMVHRKEIMVLQVMDLKETMGHQEHGVHSHKFLKENQLKNQKNQKSLKN